MSAGQQKTACDAELTVLNRSGTLKGNRSVEVRAGSNENPDRRNQQEQMEKCFERGNVLQAWKRVKSNNGAPGIDGMTVESATGYLREYWRKIREELLRGNYRPKAVREVEIPKPDGGVRKLGIPTVVDRLIQQCILQVLQPQWDPTFHHDSYGFRPRKSAHQAIRRAQALVQEGRRFVVDVDLEKFFDRVNHDILMDRVAKRVKDNRLVKLIRRYLEAGIMANGVVMERESGTPQGGPLSPLLSNLLLDEVDWKLEKRGLKFARYADDCNVYVRSKRAAERAMRTLEEIFNRLKLKINEKKSAVAYACERKFLGFRFWIGPKRIVKRAVAPQALEKFKRNIRNRTGRSCGRSLEQVIEGLSGYLEGWKGYFQLADTNKVFATLDGWIRRRLRAIKLKQWKRGTTCYRELMAKGLSHRASASIAASCRSYWRMAGSSGMGIALPNRYFDELDLSRLGA